MKDALIRAARTFVQTAVGVYLAGLVGGPVLADLYNVDLLSSARAAGIVAVLSFVQNWLESTASVSYSKG